MFKIIFVYFLIASIICYNLVLFILILIYFLLSLFTFFIFPSLIMIPPD